MKSVILVSLVSLIIGAANAQKLNAAQVPDAVKRAFMQKFANAKEVKWSKEGGSEFEAEFEVAEQEQSANFDNTGKWLMTETEIKKSGLPKSVQDAIAREFAGYKIDEAEKAESVDKGMFYEVELKSGKMRYEVQLSAEGKVIKKEEMKSKKEKD